MLAAKSNLFKDVCAQNLEVVIDAFEAVNANGQGKAAINAKMLLASHCCDASVRSKLLLVAAMDKNVFDMGANVEALVAMGADCGTRVKNNGFAKVEQALMATWARWQKMSCQVEPSVLEAAKSDKEVSSESANLGPLVINVGTAREALACAQQAEKLLKAHCQHASQVAEGACQAAVDALKPCASGWRGKPAWHDKCEARTMFFPCYMFLPALVEHQV